MLDAAIITLTALFAFTYLSTGGKISVCIFCATVLIFNNISYYIPDEYGIEHYLLAALTDLFIIYLLKKKKKPTKTTIIIQSWCVMFIITNVIGWVIYMLYYPPAAYDYLCSITYMLMLLTIIEGHRDGNINMDRNRPSFFSANYNGVIAMSSNKKATGL